MVWMVPQEEMETLESLDLKDKREKGELMVSLDSKVYLEIVYVQVHIFTLL